MHKKELVEAVAKKTGKSQKEVKETLEAILDTIKETMKSGDKVTLVGFGTFSSKERPERMGRNPQTGKSIKIKKKNVVKFKAGSDLSSSVN